MKKSLFLLTPWIILVIFITACGGLVPDPIHTVSELGPDANARLTELNDVLKRGFEVGPETRQVMSEFNQQIEDVKNTIKTCAAHNLSCVDPAALANIDRLLGVLEDGIIKVDQETLNSVNDLINTLDQAPEKWQEVMSQILEKLNQSSRKMASDWSVEIQQLVDDTKNDLIEVSQNASAIASQTIMCNVDFMQMKAGATIDKLLGKSLVQKLKALVAGKKTSEVPVIPWVCQEIPAEIHLVKNEQGQMVAQEPDVKITGFNLTGIPQAHLTNNAGVTREFDPFVVKHNSNYQLMLNLQSYDFSTVNKGDWIVFEWPLPEGITGVVNTVSAAFVFPEDKAYTEPKAELVVTGSPAPLYIGPGDHYYIKGYADQGAAYAVVAQTGDGKWIQIAVDGNKYWISSQLVKRNEVKIGISNDIFLPPPTAKFDCSPLEGNAPLSVSCKDHSEGNPKAREWLINGSPVEACFDPFTFAAAGGYQVTLHVKNEMGEDTTGQPVVITVHAELVADFSVYLPGSTLVDGEQIIAGEAPLKVVLDDHSQGGAGDPAWDFGDGFLTTGIKPVYEYQTPGDYIITQTVSNAFGQVTKSIKVHITAPPTAVPPLFGSRSVFFNHYDTDHGLPRGKINAFDTGISAESYTCGVVGYGVRANLRMTPGDIIKLYLHEIGSTWRITAWYNDEGNRDQIWSVDVMCLDNQARDRGAFVLAHYAQNDSDKTGAFHQTTEFSASDWDCGVVGFMASAGAALDATYAHNVFEALMTASTGTWEVDTDIVNWGEFPEIWKVDVLCIKKLPALFYWHSESIAKESMPFKMGKNTSEWYCGIAGFNFKDSAINGGYGVTAMYIDNSIPDGELMIEANLYNHGDPESYDSEVLCVSREIAFINGP